MQIIYSPLFKKTLNSIVNCGQNYYSKKTIIAMFSALKHSKSLLLQNPNIGVKEPLLFNCSEEFRYIVLHRYMKLIYYVDADKINFVDLWDVRQDPETLRSRVD